MVTFNTRCIDRAWELMYSMLFISQTARAFPYHFLKKSALKFQVI